MIHNKEQFAVSQAYNSENSVKNLLWSFAKKIDLGPRKEEKKTSACINNAANHTNDGKDDDDDDDNNNNDAFVHTIKCHTKFQAQNFMIAWRLGCDI